jgi:hypothetical protein
MRCAGRPDRRCNVRPPSLGDPGLQRFGLNAGELQDAPVVGTRVGEAALLAGEFSAALVEHARWQRLVLCPPSFDGKKMEMRASRFPAEEERAASGVAQLSKACAADGKFSCRPSDHVRHSGKDCRRPHRFGNLCYAATATALVQVFAIRLIDITDDEGASLIRPVI